MVSKRGNPVTRETREVREVTEYAENIGEKVLREHGTPHKHFPVIHSTSHRSMR